MLLFRNSVNQLYALCAKFYLTSFGPCEERNFTYFVIKLNIWWWRHVAAQRKRDRQYITIYDHSSIRAI